MRYSVILDMNKILTLLLILSLMAGMVSCDESPYEPTPENTKSKRTLLIYAVASNNLQSYLVDDCKEMLRAAPEVDGLGSDVRVVLYSVPSQSAVAATLSELTIDSDGTWSFTPVRTYDRNVFSTDPERMRSVFDDTRELFPSERYGLILWSHGTGWMPNFTDHQVPAPSDVKKSYGMDKYQGVTDYCDLDELAEAIPDRMFDYVWFDLCYMMGIEVAYQLRGKCDYIAGYPTEDWSMGMNYDTTLPMLASPEADLIGAARAFYDYYDKNNFPVTVTVAKTDGMERLAAAAAAVYASGEKPESTFGLQNYSRLRTGLYDFGQFTKKYLEGNAPIADTDKLLSEFTAALDEVVLFGACTEQDFYRNPKGFDPELYSGFSCHFPGTTSLADEEYYSSLDWPLAVYP